MTPSPTKQRSNRLSIVAYLIGAVVAFAVVFPTITSYPEGLIENFLYLYLPPVSIIFAAHQISQRSSAALCVSLVLCIYLSIFLIYSLIRPQHEFVYLGYLLSLPGAGVGAVMGAICVQQNWITHKIYAPLFAALATSVGLSLNQYYICHNFISCSF
jgi:hypothetical protein